MWGRKEVNAIRGSSGKRLNANFLTQMMRSVQEDLVKGKLSKQCFNLRAKCLKRRLLCGIPGSSVLFKVCCTFCCKCKHWGWISSAWPCFVFAVTHLLNEKGGTANVFDLLGTVRVR